MHAGALQALEFDRIVAAVERMAQTPPGAERLSGLAPQTERESVASALAATAETARFLSGPGEIALRAPAGLADIFEGLGVEGRALEPLQLLGLATYLESIHATASGIRRGSASFPILARTIAATSSFEPETTDIRRKIDPAGDVADDASPELRSLRERLRKQRSRLRGTLESYLRGKDTAKYLQQQIVTDRNGRYVLVVRSEHRAAIPGIVHGSSASGASLFLEPLSTVEINNDIVALEQQEAEEVRRILLELTDRFRRRGPELDTTIEAATALDVLQAKARYSLGIDGIDPKLAADGRLELRGARHPLLIAQGIEVVAVDVVVIPPTRVLVITGPNTGGKTVALKTAGLLPLMAQAGLLIPAAAGSQIPVFRSVFADIGDEQSIAENLSTFSGHISNIVGMDKALSPPALVLLDEAGSGTDPNEGGALAMSIIDHFRRRGAMVVATTHFDALKTYASTTEGVASAGFGFNPHTFAPTYRLNYGSPGSSLALEIASRLGLPQSIIEQARGVRGEREAQLAEHLAKIDRELQDLEHQKRLVAREQQTVRETQARLHAREQELKDREETFRRRLDQRIDERMREARREIDAVVEGLKARASTIASNAERKAARLVPTGEIGSARSDARSALDAVGTKLRDAVSGPSSAPPAPPAERSRPAAVGDRVAVGVLGLEGTVQSIQDGHADVDVRGKRMRAKIGELRVLAAAVSGAPKPQVRVNVDMAPRTASLSELNVIGSTSDEAVTKVERFIDDAMMSDVKSVRIIHGYGTGQLRRSIAEFLKGHPYVAHFGPAPDNQGGGGVTVAELKE
ncbi:MAG TPA: endonuclease MutS2 [Vicinamibacterales bacterium]|jgi:DNA mismatch repair protein MutS2|nr:endonuclease MutS2 [Vicinamibacterales bacterium]